MFSVCSQEGGEGGTYLKVLTPPPGQGTYPPARSGWGRGYPKVPTPYHGTYPPVRSGWGRGYAMVSTPHQSTYPPVQVRMEVGGTQGTYLHLCQGTYPLSRSEWGYSKVPTPWDRTAYGVLDTLQSVCLLLSRRPFLLCVEIFHFVLLAHFASYCTTLFITRVRQSSNVPFELSSKAYVWQRYA